MKRFRWLGVILALALVAGACGRSGSDKAAVPSGTGTATTAAANAKCSGVTLEATDTGVTADTITVQVMADTGSPLAPGLFQGNVDAMRGFEKYINANGGIGCRKLKVEEWDSKLTPDEAKNGQINACQTAVASVGGNALFNPDPSEIDTCKDASGQPVGIANVVALANDINEQCAANTYSIAGTADTCPPGGGVPTGYRPFTVQVGFVDYAKTINPDLVGLYMVPGDLPTTVQTATGFIAAQAEAGVTWAQVAKVSGSMAQSSYTPIVQAAKNSNVNYVYNGSNDTALISIRREAAAQGYEPEIWMCTTACYTDKFKAAGADVEGTLLYTSFLPFEDKGTNQELDNYLANVAVPDAFGAQAWMAGVLFQQAVQEIVDKDGPNAITRANLLTALNGIKSFDANGWMGPRDPKGGSSDCLVMMKVEGGQFVRTNPDDKGKLDCNPDYLVTASVDPAVEAGKIQ